MPAPAWQFEQCYEGDGWLIRVHGQYIMDAETGRPEVFRPPSEISSSEELEQWRKQVMQTIGRLSGVPVKFEGEDGDQT